MEETFWKSWGGGNLSSEYDMYTCWVLGENWFEIQQLHLSEDCLKSEL